MKTRWLHMGIALIVLGVMINMRAFPAGVPDWIHHQGRVLKDDQPHSGQVELVIRLYANAVPTEGETLLYEDVDTVIVIDGAYSTYIGDTSSHGSLADALTHEEVYLETHIDGQVMHPRQRMVSVAYAMVAGEVEANTVPLSSYREQGAFEPAPTASGTDAIAQGAGAVAEGDYSVVGGGESNRALGIYAVIGGGENNSIEAGSDGSVIGGGHGNTMHSTGFQGVIVGGGFNDNRATDAAIVGGQDNSIWDHASHSFIGSGFRNRINSDARFAVIPGGRQNKVAGSYGFAAGRRANALHEGAFVWSDSNDADFSSTDADQFLVRAGGGVQLHGDVSIEDGNLEVHGEAHVRVLEIETGLDVAEPFSTSLQDDIPEGSVVILDEQHPGRVKLSNRPYDSRVVGVVSGAGGLQPGLVLSQGHEVDGTVRVALTGRVYVLTETANGTIQPGDLLTSSGVPGFAMKAADRQRAFGSVIGKAMTGLDQPNGLVLVLVGLQ